MADIKEGAELKAGTDFVSNGAKAAWGRVAVESKQGEGASAPHQAGLCAPSVRVEPK